jgi:hypothetical protein
VTHTLGLIGVPSSAGAHWPGQEQSPAALRAAGLIARLRAGGISVVDHGDLPAVRCVPQPPADSRPGSSHRTPSDRPDRADGRCAYGGRARSCFTVEPHWAAPPAHDGNQHCAIRV